MKHVLILFTDQQRYDTIGAYGNPLIQTPNLDRLVADSIVFERCITPSPVCVPARLSLMSGQYPARTGNNNNNKKKKYEGEGLYAKLTGAGYNSCNVGKMHYVWDTYGPIGFGRRHTQEEMSHFDDDYTNFILNSPYRNVFDYNGQRSEMYYVPQVSQLPAEAHPTQWVGDRSVEFLKSCDPRKPVFLFSSFIHPHPPFSPPAPWNKLYRSEDIPAPFMPENIEEFRPLQNKKYGTERLGISATDAKKLKNFYYACVSFVDYQIGRIINTLKERGMYDDTLIIFTSDHGECLGDYNSMGKRTMLDAAAHIPMIMHVPGRRQETRRDVCSLVDVAPTILSWAGIDYDPAEYDGVDLLRGRHDYVYSQYNGRENGGVYMIAGAFEKLIYDSAGDKYYYFDSFPETKNKYDENDPHIAGLRGLLMKYYESDVGESPKPEARKHPSDFGVEWMDHTARHDEEAARIPEGYRIDLR
ncbi:MAG TPA: sulfatase-like hydrolase/transferase [Clostridiales bacterium]|jgi:arylsulfatase|nr:sulfatase-like hydrolase/transferase [Clostridiales bacterium]